MSRRVGFGFAACVAVVTILMCRAAFAAAPTGRLAYVHNGAVCVARAASLGAGQVQLPQSQGTVQFSLSPGSDGTVVFVAPRRDKPSSGDGDSGTMQVFFSRPPYVVSKPLPIFLTKEDDTTITWTTDGKAEIGIGDLRTRLLDPKTGRLTVEDDGAAKKARPRSAGSAGGVAFTDGDGRVIVETTSTGQDRTLFSPAAPTALFTAVQHAHNPAKLKEIADEIDPALWKDLHNWSVGSAALTPDGKTVFFAANLGTGMGAQGNTNFCLFAADARTGKLSVLSKCGDFFGRVPIDCEVSPDGARLFFATSAHSSAADNPFSGYVVDLPTQQVREVLHNDAGHEKDSNLMDGWCWSPDGRYVAVAVLYFDPLKVGADSDPDMGECSVYVKDAATGRSVRVLARAHLPAWGRE